MEKQGEMNVIDLLDGTEYGKLKVRVFTFLKDRKTKYEGNTHAAVNDVSDVFKLSLVESEILIEEWVIWSNP